LTTCTIERTGEANVHKTSYSTSHTQRAPGYMDHSTNHQNLLIGAGAAKVQKYTLISSHCTAYGSNKR
jgi:hypothetical protein